MHRSGWLSKPGMLEMLMGSVQVWAEREMDRKRKKMIV
jgi:hypothetical protein